MDYKIKNRTLSLLLDEGRLLSMEILQQQTRDFNELLSDDNMHTKVRNRRDCRRISKEHFDIMFPPTDLRQPDTNNTPRVLTYCADIEEPQRKILDELYERRNKAMEMYNTLEISNEVCTSEWETIVRFLEKRETCLSGPLDGEIDKVTCINIIKQGNVTLEDMDRVKSWNEFESKDTDTGYEDTLDGRSLVHDTAYHGKLSTLTYMSQEFPDRLLERDKNGNHAVHFAAEGGHIECLRFIFESFPDLQMARNENGLNALHCAARGGNVDCLTYLIGKGMNTDTSTNAGDTLLHIAVFGGSLQMVKYVYESCPGLRKERNMKGQDALYRAARGGNLDCLKYLIDQGMDINTRSTYENTLLHAAANGGHVTMVQYILETFSYMKNETDVKGMDALFSAVRGESAECLTYLVGQDMKMDTRSKYGSTLLHEAAFRGSLSMVQYICKTVPDLKNERTHKGIDALFSALHGESVDCLVYLVGQGMKVDTRSKFGTTLLHEAAFRGSLTMVQYICKTVPDLKNERTQNGMDALFSAVRGGSLDCVKYLISQGMKIDSRSKYGDTILHQAAFDGHEGVVRYLCENYPQLLSYKQSHGQTAIFSAIIGGHFDMFKYLLIQIDPIQTDKSGHTILHAAAKKGKSDIVRYLCTAYRFLNNMTGFKGETALDLARINGHFECEEIIQEQLCIKCQIMK